MSKHTFSDRTTPLVQSGIRSASARCSAVGGINLGQGVCDIPAQMVIKEAAAAAIFQDKNLYAPQEGVHKLKVAVAEKLQKFNGITSATEADILISHGSTGAFVAAITTLCNPGDEVILFEPYYGYHRHTAELMGAKVIAMPINYQDFSIDFDRLKATITSKTRIIVVCTPCNPSGKVFSREELIILGEIAKQYNLFIVTDEIYEYIVYPGFKHISLASLNDYSERTITISGFSKTFNITGWRLGYATGPRDIIQKMALVHDILYVCPPTPLQHAMLAALMLGQSYYDNMREEFIVKKDLTVSSLRTMGFKLHEPQGAYYLMADFSALGFADDNVAANALLEEAKVAVVPGRAFYSNPNDGKYLLRFCFALSEDKIKQALNNIAEFLQKR